MSFFNKIKEGLKKTTAAVGNRLDDVISSFHQLDEDFLEELFEMMVLADMGTRAATAVSDQLRAKGKKQKIDTKEALLSLLETILVEEMGADCPLTLEKSPMVVLVIGVNGVGKTTSIGKIAARYTAEGKKVLLCAADTFRAAAADQLTIWAERAGCEIIRHKEGSDPAAVVFDAMTAAKARGVDIVLCDTAGRLHNKQNLMNELAKISRVIDRELPGASRETLLVLDATTGQNAVSQAEEFNKVAQLTGIVLTKLDGTAKGGIAVAIAAGMKIPVRLIGVGEKMGDLMDFSAKDFIKALLERE